MKYTSRGFSLSRSTGPRTVVLERGKTSGEQFALTTIVNQLGHQGTKETLVSLFNLQE